MAVVVGGGDHKQLSFLLLGAQFNSTEWVIGFSAAGFLLPTGTMRMSFFTTAGHVACSSHHLFGSGVGHFA